MTTTESGLTLRPRTRDDDPRLLELYLQHEDVFCFSLDGWRWHMDERSRKEGKQPVMFVAEVGGVIVGDLYLEPHYSGTDGIFFAFVEVDNAYQDRGFGADLWLECEQQLRDRDVTKVYCTIPEDRQKSIAFAEHRGFSGTRRADRISRLVLSEANLDGYAGIDDEMAAKGITIVVAGDLPSDDDRFMRKLHEATSSMVRDIPRTESEWEPDPYELWRANWLAWPNSIPDAYFVALQAGEPVGMANLQTNGESGLLNGLTGVVPSARHQGIARALKFKTIEWAKSKGFEHIDTANDSSNTAMLSINIPLGYKALPARLEFLKEYGS